MRLPEDHDFTVFLERFSQDSRYYPVDARAFVAELYQRWSARNPAASATPQALSGQPGRIQRNFLPAVLFSSVIPATTSEQPRSCSPICRRSAAMWPGSTRPH